MGSVASHLIDTSASARIHIASVASVLDRLIETGLVATCGPLDFEDLFSARNHDHYLQTLASRRDGYEYIATGDEEWRRAFEVQQELSARGRLRDVGMPDLLIAAVAERHRLTLLHYDADFETIAEITGQDARWVVPRGSVA